MSKSKQPGGEVNAAVKERSSRRSLLKNGALAGVAAQLHHGFAQVSRAARCALGK